MRSEEPTIDPCPVCKADAAWRGNSVDGWISCETSGCIIGGTFLNTGEGRAAAAAQWNDLASAARLERDMNRLDTATCNIHILHTVDELDAWIVGTSSADVDVIKSASLADALTRLAAALGEEGE